MFSSATTKSETVRRWQSQIDLYSDPSMTYVAHVELTFIETSIFTRQITGLLRDDELNALEWALMANPERGDIIRGSGGLRKIRWLGSGRGKRGGLRIIYYWHVPESTVLFLLAYPKNEQEDLTSAQLKILKHIIETEYK
jgi:mRNA-degrading endonuclease RelE of RelBE toxin-antitoxin system